jgi:hypothetical protein
VVILFCFHKSHEGKKKKEGCAAWPNLSSNGHDLFSFFLRGFYENKPSHSALRQKTTDNQKPTPKPLRVFAPSREPTSLSAVHGCPSIISREDAKARRRGRRLDVKLQQTPPLPEDCVVSAPSICDLQRRLGSSFNTSLHMQTIRQRWTPAYAGDHGEDCASLGDLCDLCANNLVHAETAKCAEGRPYTPLPLPEESAIFEVHFSAPLEVRTLLVQRRMQSFSSNGGS